MIPVETVQGDGPIVLGLPHTGTFVPDHVLDALNPRGRKLTDTDWHIDRLYKGLLPNATTVRATFHRYVIDANRDPSGQSLYPGQNTTGLCPTIDFDDNPIYSEGREPDIAEIERRRQAFHAPYHRALEAELSRVRARHGIAILYDCHSIRSEIPFLFPGRLPDFNIGTNLGVTCDPAIEKAAADICEGAKGYTTIRNGRFKGGWTTRHYGKPVEGVHAIQMELVQARYLATENLPFSYDEQRANKLRGHLSALLQRLEQVAAELTV